MTALTPVPAPDLSGLMNPETFQHMQRVGTMLANSALFPEHLRKGSQQQAVANAVLVIDMAQRLNENPLTVAQNIFFVGGKPGWSTSYLISKANQHGVFKNPIDWEVTGEGKNLSVNAFAETSGTGKRVEFTCDMAMAEAEQWTRNPKYKSMPQLMLRYRSAAALIRLYCPEVMIGVPSQIELETGEMRDITPQTHQATNQPSPDTAKDASVVEAEVVDPDASANETPQPDAEPAPEKTTAQEHAPNDPEPDTDAQGEAKLDQEHGRNLLKSMLIDLKEAGAPDAVATFYADQIPKLPGDLLKEWEQELAKAKA
ncbi:MAG: hypothetical protein AAGF94_18110 [Pseudomonadota bacterium]